MKDTKKDFPRRGALLEAALLCAPRGSVPRPHLLSLSTDEGGLECVIVGIFSWGRLRIYMNPGESLGGSSDITMVEGMMNSSRKRALSMSFIINTRMIAYSVDSLGSHIFSESFGWLRSLNHIYGIICNYSVFLNSKHKAYITNIF